MKPYTYRAPDGALQIEWIHPYSWRFGISLEVDDRQSGWYLVSMRGLAKYGSVPAWLSRLLKWVLRKAA